MTRLGDLLDFGQVLKPLATINLPKSPIFLDNFCKGVKIYLFLAKSFLGNCYRHLAIFIWSHWLESSFANLMNGVELTLRGIFLTSFLPKPFDVDLPATLLENSTDLIS